MSDEEYILDGFEDDEDWLDLEPSAKGAALLPEVQIRLSKAMRGNPKQVNGAPKAFAFLAFRREAADWMAANGPRFKVQIGGGAANKIRLIPDQQRGLFEAGAFRGTFRINLRHVNLWPDEDRDAIDVSWAVHGNALHLTLPSDFARPCAQANAEPVAKPASPQVLMPKVAVPQIVLLNAAAKPAEKTAIEEDTRVLETALGVTRQFPCDFGGIHLTRQEADLVEVLLKRTEVSVESALIATHDASVGDDERNPKIVDVLLCKIRKKLEPLGISVVKEWGGAMRINAAGKGRLRTFVAKAEQEKVAE
jgi:hypothetical protein